VEAPVIYKINTNQLRLDAMAEALGEPLGNPLYLNEERGRDYFIAQFDVLVDKHQMRKDYVDDLEKVTVKLEQQIADLEAKLVLKDKKIIMQTMMLRKKQHKPKKQKTLGTKKAYFKK
jgi:3-methyladenine DNA glycosylase AlkD